MEYYSAFPHTKILSQVPGWKLIKLIKEFDPDAIFTDVPYYQTWMSKFMNRPLLVHLRGDIWSEFYWGFRTLYKMPKKWLLYWKWFVQSKGLKKADLLLPICQWLGKRIKERLPHKPIHVLYQGIDASHWHPSKSCFRDPPRIGLLQDANIHPKVVGMLKFSKAVEKMRSVEFYWAGGGPYTDLVLKEFGKYDNFHHVGRLDRRGVHEFLGWIDVYALPSGQDCSPLTLLEAQLMEKPVVASNVGGIPENMVDRVTGLLVDNDPQEWVDAIEWILSNESEAIEMGIRGREFVEENFAWPVIAKAFLRAVEKVIEGHDQP